MKYRSDIDGLRALAVLSVIVYHISEALLPGGFVGVDIFFVLSGYLITLHIISELDRDRFSLAEFYRRRIKRIAPAMLVVLGVTMIAAQFILLPEDAEMVADSALWSLLSLANVYFWLFQDTSYFAESSSELPLLHLWSLGVEEQFYVLWPLILMLAYRAAHRLAFALVAGTVAVASFAFGQWYFPSDPSFVYYMLPTRAGELLVGALLAHYVNNASRDGPGPRVAGACAVLGLLLVTGSLALVSQERVFPGFQAVPPTLGTAMLVLAGQYGDHGITRFFRLRPLVWVGLISYSAYLVHWPILAFLRYAKVQMSVSLGIAVVVLTLLLAWLNYLFVEQPLRRTRRSALQVFLRQFAAPVAVLGCAALVAMKLDGYGVREWVGTYKQDLASVRQGMIPPYAYEHVCQHQRLAAGELVDDRCVVGTPSAGQRKTLLVGDSIAAQYVGMLEVFAAEGRFAFRNIETSACPLVDGDPAPFVTAARLSDCRASLALLRPALEDYDVLMISSAWAYYHMMSDAFFPRFAAAVEPLLASGKKIILIAKPPLVPGYDRRCREKALSIPFIDCAMADMPIGEDVRLANERLRDYARQTPGVSFFDPTVYLCPDQLCRVFEPDGEPNFYDYGHLSIPASTRLGERIVARDGVPSVFEAVVPRR